MASGESNKLCFECGLCCNGVIFANGELQEEDDVPRLEALGLRLLPYRQSRHANRKFLQPCAAFDGCRCQIYSERPEYCRQFECLLLKSVQSGKTSEKAALRIIRRARQGADTVVKLLEELGDTDEQLSLTRRFRKVHRRLESKLPDKETAELFSRLSLAVHDLNVILSESFYHG